MARFNDNNFTVNAESSCADKTFTIDQFWSLLVDGSIQFLQLLTVDIRINRLNSWKQLKIYHTLPIPNLQHNLHLVNISLC